MAPATPSALAPASFADCSLTAFGGIVGGFAGYNLQSGRVVYGIEVDGSWTGLKKSVSTPDAVGISGANLMTFTGRVDWLATARGRLGITMSPTLLYVTGGAAFGGVKSSWTDNDPAPNTSRWLSTRSRSAGSRAAASSMRLQATGWCASKVSITTSARSAPARPPIRHHLQHDLPSSRSRRCAAALALRW